jgi:hypothetical protein
MKKIIFFFLLSVNLCFAQSIGLYQTGLAASSPTINVMAGNQITVNNTLENCVPNYDGSDCLLSYVDYELDFYLVQGTTEYHLGNELSLVAGVNCSASQPCPCGYYNHPDRACSCPTGTVERYLNKVSGPLLDRIDLHIEVTPVSYSELREERSGESSEVIRNRVNKARNIQRKRFEEEVQRDPTIQREAHKDSIISSNADMSSKQIRKYCQLDNACAEILKKAMEKFGFSARAYDRILKVARTIADLDGVADIGTRHIAEAVQYRSLDRKEWGG